MIRDMVAIVSVSAVFLNTCEVQQTGNRIPGRFAAYRKKRSFSSRTMLTLNHTMCSMKIVASGWGVVMVVY
jgi:hypothetical protein